jgi:prevent-host-death family protein
MWKEATKYLDIYTCRVALALSHTAAEIMKLSSQIKPISYLKAHASEILRDVSSNRKTMVITQNGEAKAVLQDVKIYEEMQESLALLKMLALSTKSKNKKKVKPVESSFQGIRVKINQRKSK